MELLEPGKFICIDESMISFKGRHKLKQFMPAKPIKWGFKMFLLCDSASGYVHKLRFFKGGEKFHPYNITMDLLQGCEGKGVHVTMDNWYSSVRLTEDLLDKGIKSTCILGKALRHFRRTLKIKYRR